MPYLAVKRNPVNLWGSIGQNGDEFICELEPYWYDGRWNNTGKVTILDKGVIKQLTGEDLSWNDNPIKVKETK